MKKYYFTYATLFLLIGLLSVSFLSYSQTYTLPDTSLRNKLIASYPSVMTGNLLNITAAGSLSGTLNLSNASISDADGIQYFTGISSLDLKNNKLTSLPDISGLTQLISLFLSYNNLVTIPSIASFPNLVDFQVSNNQLTSLPTLSGNTNLRIIYCQNNKLTSLPAISMLTNLEVLVVGNNNFTQLPDFSPLLNLEELHVHKTGIDTIKGLSALSNLRVLYAWGNQIRDLSALNTNTTLETFVVYNNMLKALPVLSNKPSLTNVSVVKNHLTFEDILPLSSLPGFASFDYHPQKRIPLSSYTVREKDSVTFDLSIDQALSTNSYTWYKNGTILTTNQTGVYSIASAVFADSGTYYVEVTNLGLTGLTLQSDSAMLSVKPCLELNGFVSELRSESCTEGTTIQLTQLKTLGGIAPFDYGVVKVTKTDTLYQATTYFESLLPGMYQFIVRDSRMCKAMQPISIKNPTECHIIMSPNGDGFKDTYYIEYHGLVKIYNIGRRLIKELNAPAEWDGTTSDGSHADAGYYAIVIDDKKIANITVVR